MRIYELKYLGVVEHHFKDWFRWARCSQVALTVHRHWQNIKTYFENPITNAASESINSKIQIREIMLHGVRPVASLSLICIAGCVGSYHAAPALPGDDGPVLRSLEPSVGKSLALDTAAGRVKGTLQSVDHHARSVVVVVPSDVFQQADTVTVPAGDIRGWRSVPSVWTDIAFAAFLAALVTLIVLTPPLVVQ